MGRRQAPTGIDSVALCKALAAHLRGMPDCKQGNPVGQREAARTYPGVSLSALSRMAAQNEKNAAFHEEVLALDMAVLERQEAQIRCTIVVNMHSKKGTVLRGRAGSRCTAVAAIVRFIQAR
jgi:hypothetical protein